MDIRETAQVLAKVASVDNRRGDELTIASWHEIIGHLDKADCLDAVTAHRQQEPGVWLEPGHVLARVKAVHRARVAEWKRLNRCDVPEIPADLDQVRERAWLREFWGSVRDGNPEPVMAADLAHGITRQALPPADPEKVRAIESLAAGMDIRTARSAALRTINQEARA